MIRTFNVAGLSLAVAVALGACGGGGTATDQTDILAEDAATATDAVTEAGADVAAAASEATDEVVDAASTTTAAVADAAGEGWTTMQGDWESSAGIVKDRWAELTEEEILGTGGDREQLVGLVQERYGIERDQAETEVNEWAATL